MDGGLTTEGPDMGSDAPAPGAARPREERRSFFRNDKCNYTQ